MDQAVRVIYLDLLQNVWVKMKVIKSDLCFKCRSKTNKRYLFCEDCTPIYGETVSVYDGNLNKRLTLYIGKIPFWRVIAYRLKGESPVKWWMGTDALTIWYQPPGKRWIVVILHRIKMRLLEPFIFQHWVTGPRLIADLEKSNAVQMDTVVVAYWPGEYHRRVKKIEHEGFNVLYYDPNSGPFERWKYGIAIIEEIKKRVSDVNWIKTDGTQDMKRIYPVVDLYIRPSGHDGEPRINAECKLNRISVIYSEDGKPSVECFINQINALKHKKRWIKNQYL